MKNAKITNRRTDAIAQRSVIMKHSKLTACLLLAMLCVAGNAEQYKKPKRPYHCIKTSAEFDSEVSMIMSIVQKNVYDYDKDGKVNCKDYAVLFKKTWDKYFDSWKCMIIRNYNEHTDFSHLFVSVWDDKTVNPILIETWMQEKKLAYSHKDWCMNCVWGDRYDMYYDYFHETEYWLKGNKTITAPVFD